MAINGTGQLKKSSKNRRCFNITFLTVISLISIILIFSPKSQSRPISPQEAQKAVEGWLSRNNEPFGISLSKQVAGVESYTDSGGEVMYYAVQLEGNGFLIVPAEDMVEPVVAIVTGGSFDPSEDNPLGALVSGDVPARVTAARSLSTANNGSIQTQDPGSEEQIFSQSCLQAQDKWEELLNYEDAVGTMGLSSVSDIRISPLIQSTWGQTTADNTPSGKSCYNYYTPPGPDGSSSNYPIGCVATAMSQVLRYYQYPAGYNWANMPLQPDSSITLAQQQAIGGLCYDTAIAISTTFGPGGSSASVFNADIAFVSYFGYSNSIRSSSPTVGTKFNNMINPNLDSGYPAILGISRTGGGHAAIADGYGYNGSTLYHHLNLGWNGNSTAWYALPTVNTSSYTYTNIDDCLYNVYKTGTGEIISGRVTDMGGNPIPGVTVTASASGQSTRQTITDTKGIYGLANVASNTNYTVTASKPNHAFITNNASTGKSLDGSGNSGNVWGVNFQSQSAAPPIAYDGTAEAISGTTQQITLNATDEGYPNPPAMLTYIITSLPRHGTLADPQAGNITSVPYTLANNGNKVDYWPCRVFVGEDNFKFKANDGGTPPQAGESAQAVITINVSNIIYTTFEPQTDLIGSWPMYTSYHDSRTQVIYLASEIGGARVVTDLALNVYTVPGQALNKWTIRMKHTSQSTYVGYPLFETSGWTVVYQADEPQGSTGWRNFHFQNPFTYNGSSNLLIDFSHNNTYYTTDGVCYISDMSPATRVMLSFADSTHGDPLNWTSYTCPGVYTSTGVPNIKLISKVSGVQMTGDLDSSCDINLYDYTIMAKAWLTSPGDPNWDQDCDISSPLNIIDAEDIEALSAFWLDSMGP